MGIFRRILDSFIVMGIAVVGLFIMLLGVAWLFSSFSLHNVYVSYGGFFAGLIGGGLIVLYAIIRWKHF